MGRSLFRDSPANARPLNTWEFACDVVTRSDGAVQDADPTVPEAELARTHRHGELRPSPPRTPGPRGFGSSRFVHIWWILHGILVVPPGPSPTRVRAGKEEGLVFHL